MHSFDPVDFFLLSRCFLFIALFILVTLVASVASVTVLMLGKIDNQRIDQGLSKGVSLSESLDKRLTAQENNSRLLVAENAELKNMFEELQGEQNNTSKKLEELQEKMKNLEGLEELQKKVNNFQTRLNELEEQGEQKNTSKKVVQ